MVDFISEVQEELRKDDYNRWLKKYGPLLGAVIFLIVAGTAYLQWQDSRAEKLSEDTSYEYIEIVDTIGSGESKAVSAFTSLSEAGPDGYAWVSLKRAAELELDKGNKDAAVALFDKAAAAAPKVRHKQLAQLKASYILASQGNFEAVKTRLPALIEKDQPFQFLARELMALAAQKTGDVKTARMHLAYIEANPGASESVVRRAKQNLMLLNYEAPETVEETENSPELEQDVIDEPIPAEKEDNE